MAHTQDNRHIAITTPLGKDVLLLKGFSGQEAMSRLFSFDLELLSEADPAIDFDAIVGKNVTISVKHPDGVRYINGIVRRFSQRAGDPSFAQYRAEVVPWLWLLTQTADCRIFQNMSVPDIIQKIFKDLGFNDFKLSLVGAFPPREYCVQYRETDFNFVSRLMEQYGIYYFFEHADGKHTLVLANTPDAEPDCTPSAVTYHAPTGAVVTPQDVVSDLAKEQEIRPGKYALSDYNFVTPSVKLGVSVESVYPKAAGVLLEVYDYPGEYQKRDEGDTLVKLRIEEEEAQRSVLHGTSGCRQFTPGHKFQLKGHARADFDATYVLESVAHSAAEHGYETGGAEGDFSYSNSFTCMPAKVPFRPPRVTPKPVIQGSQTAEVVGPKGGEIFTDKYGRVKVQFHWDREGKKDENSSLWIRVSHPWAGKGWGSVSIPRIGQEVIVDFLEGDPDQPLVTGRVYNGELMPPYGLPAGGVVSGLKSNTTPGGGGSNEMSMDDTKGKEKITVHAQYDMSTTVEHIDTQAVKNNRVITVDGTHTETIAKNTTITINEALTETVKNAIDITSTDSEIFISAKTTITLMVGSSSLTMKQDGTIEIVGVNISVDGEVVGIDGAASVRIHGDEVSSTGTSSHNTEGGIVVSNGTSTNTVKGGMVMLNP